MVTIQTILQGRAGINISFVKSIWLSLLVSIVVILCLLTLFAALHPIGDHSVVVQKENSLVPVIFLGFYYLLFLLLILSTLIKGTLNGVFSYVLDKVAYHRLAISFVIVIGMLPVFVETHYVAWINNLSIALIYGLLLLNVVQIAQQTLHPFRLDKRNQRLYILYAVLVAVLFSFIPVVENFDPYGTRFQLQILCFLLLGHLVFSWLFGQWQLLKELNNQKTEAELRHLKSQVNPHFFFNTLNSLYGLAIEKSDSAPSIILKLSEVMRYSIYQAEQNRVPLQSELNYLENFIQLQQLRFDPRVDVQCQIDIDNGEQLIAPLLLINLLENAYKHGVEAISEKAWIRLNISLKAGLLICHISNNTANSLDLMPQVKVKKATSGLGLRNLAKRLELIYPHQHQMVISNKNKVFDVKLSIQLDESLNNEQ